MSLFYFAIVLYWPMVGSGSRSWTKFLRILLLHTLLSSLVGPVTCPVVVRLATYLCILPLLADRIDLDHFTHNGSPVQGLVL